MNPGDVDLPATFSLAVPAYSRLTERISPVDELTTTRDRFERALRWYPLEWRRRNAQVVIGILRDQADARGADRPGFADRAALAIGGMRERVVAPEPFTRLGMVSLVLLAALSVFYFAVIAWAPGLGYLGTFGPFTNASVIAGFIFVATLGLAIARHPQAARVFALVGIAVEISVGILSSTFTWLGPSWGTVALFVGLATVAAFPPHGLWQAVTSIGALVLLVAALTFVPTAWPYFVLFAPAAIVTVTVVTAALAAGAVFVAVRLRRFRP